MNSTPKGNGRIVVRNLDPGFIHEVKTVNDKGEPITRIFHIRRPSAITEATIHRVDCEEETKHKN